MRNGKSQQLRIIGGRWRGRKLLIPEVEGLRPTPDRVRETLFNWIAADCPGAKVLDCFAGSGALGFEAVSREARQVTMIEKNHLAWQNLVDQAERLEGKCLDIRHGDAIQLIPELTSKYDLVFVDPPFSLGELKQAVIDKLLQYELLNPGALFYFEWAKSEPFELPSSEFCWRKQKTAGQVNYAMVEWLGSR
ncbi:MAG: 16S rRNA (guanine966-N2)-methyltransferase [Gammaproteobacteria bacterium]|jgi:16S rRNA (guanine966-N2)-methyltransferase